MLSDSIVEFCKQKDWWFSDESEIYKLALKELGIPFECDFAQFFLHAEDGPSFIGKHGELLHICWHFLNTNYKESAKEALKALNINCDFLLLSSLEFGGGYIYNIMTQKVTYIELGKLPIGLQNGEPAPQWKSINDFLEFFLEI